MSGIQAAAEMDDYLDTPVITAAPGETQIEYSETISELSKQFKSEEKINIPSMLTDVIDPLPPREAVKANGGTFGISDAEPMISLTSQLIPGQLSYDELLVRGYSSNVAAQELVVIVSDIPIGDIYRLTISSGSESYEVYGNAEVPAIIKIANDGGLDKDFRIYIHNAGETFNNSKPYSIFITRRYVSDEGTLSLPNASFYHTTGFDSLYSVNLTSLPTSSTATSIIVKGTLRSPASYRDLRYNLKMSTSYGKEVTIYNSLHTNRVTGLSNIWNISLEPLGVYNNYCTFNQGGLIIYYNYDVLNY